MNKKNNSSIIVERIIKAAKQYQKNIVGKTFLIMFEGRVIEILFKTENFLHLCGVDSSLYAKDFYRKAVRGKLNAKEIGFSTAHPYVFANIKTAHLSNALSIFERDSLVITDVSTGSKEYRLGTTDLDVVFCFDYQFNENGVRVNDVLIPYSLRVENISNDKFNGIFEVDYVLSKKTGTSQYSDMEFGNAVDFIGYLEKYDITRSDLIEWQ